MPTFTCDLSAAPAPLTRFFEHTVGSGHAPLALRADWQQQLGRCHRELGFRHVRFHDLLSGLGTLICHEEELLYSFFNANRITDFLLSIGMRPFVELSFMPATLASGAKTVFNYASNVTPPKDPAQWAELVRRLVQQWVDRYGAAEVARWYFEVWNEPNLHHFWTGTREDYFELYRQTAHTIKGVDRALRVGGPSTAANEWIEEFLDFCERNDLPADFVTTHHYPTDAFGEPGDDTETQLAKSRRSVLRDQAAESRRRARGQPLYYTEWNTSSNPRDPLHDQPYAAAFVAKTVMEANGLVEGYSFWTFTDVFEENYFPSVPFHGGFGLLNLHGVPKPTYRAYEILHGLGRELLPVAGSHPTVDAWAVRDGASFTWLLTNHALPRHPIETERVRLELREAPAVRAAWIRRIDEDHANPRRAWVEMGEPEYPTPRQVEELEEASRLEPERQSCQSEDGVVRLDVQLPPHAVAAIRLELEPGDQVSSRALAIESARAAPRTRRERLRRRPSAEPAGAGPPQHLSPDDEAMLERIQRSTFQYFVGEANPRNGLVKDTTREAAPCSITAVGLGLAAYVAAAERGFVSRAEAIERTLATLRFFWTAPQSESPDATGYQGFFYHFLEMESGRRHGGSEISTIDTTFLLAGALAAAAYFDGDSDEEREIRELADALYRRADWNWAQNGHPAVSHGWHPEKGFLTARWSGYNEALLLYALGLGSPTHPLPEESYPVWTETYRWKKLYGQELLYAGALFIHQLSHVWIDFRGIQDAYMRERGSDYFENSRRATYVQRDYAVRNPRSYRGYGEYVWGITASDGPGPATHWIDGVPRRFFDYAARGVPFGPDDGTIAPWAVVASLPFAPEIVLPTLRNLDEHYPEMVSEYGFKCSFNPTFPSGSGSAAGWVSKGYYGLDQGPIVLMIENYRTGLIWELMRRCPYVVEGLRRAGFNGGWLE